MRAAPVLAVLVLLAGCTVATGTPAPEPAVVTSAGGALSLDWTIKGVTDPNLCHWAGATAIEVTVFAAANQALGTFQQSCSVFSTSIALDPGQYTAQVKLIDAAAVARSRPLSLDPFTILERTELISSIDFPASAF